MSAVHASAVPTLAPYRLPRQRSARRVPGGLSTGVFLLSAQFPGQGHAEALERTVTAAVAAEQAGLDSVWLAEHHFVPYGVCPDAATLAGLLLGRTRRVRIGTAVSVLPTHHPVRLGEQAALLHLTSGGRFTLGVGRGGPWVDLAVFGGGAEAYEQGFPESLDLLLRWLRSSRVGADGPRYSFPEVAVVPRATEQPFQPHRSGSRPGLAPLAGRQAGSAQHAFADSPAPEPLSAGGSTRTAGGPPVVVACTSLGTVRLAAQQGVPMLLGMHSGDEDKAEMVAAYRAAALEAGRTPDQIARIEAEHVAAGVAQVADRTADARARLMGSMPEFFRHGLGAHRTVDGRERRMRDADQYTELLCDLHAVGTPKLCADRLLATHERTGIRRFALLVEGSGDRVETVANIARLGAEVLPQLPQD
ncbi:LLM class flavin-dependent oxidoreductase [Streptacidiphilus jiangxiensis]|uniref:Flavin-dependent oxidoreductase, luciferase family (Includes alkanesulfonate monooxygenase SsuD and methylene tetrahydromethanopterin reductase) n=1 Tax=Streptacidiphilus jiangxiensis TaxID=235985 RepID=A0A1H7G8J7_STRJI|nr:LLM class flavin-dependent oxidoreductase [Streptacidiphilus jiangxiensis]SEK34448.1 Flavin-dependent oxidoreductase, luciferase family (includes alkanesulfonate monooxygenase SsuD and methylene tetrahydromethanopterin reductase) [Streptacidiphilus jiangxiensis]